MNSYLLISAGQRFFFFFFLTNSLFAENCAFYQPGSVCEFDMKLLNSFVHKWGRGTRFTKHLEEVPTHFIRFSPVVRPLTSDGGDLDLNPY